MLNHQLLDDEAILVLEPDGPLKAQDFEAVAAEVDPFIEKHDHLRGVMVESESFPGWADLASMAAHLKFVRNHHKKIERIAIVTDDNVMSHFPDIANHFVAAEVRHFPYVNKMDAYHWLSGKDVASKE
ncbi:hypothetical protein Pan97_15610 [Bremerella volcania]|uniref:SpoIIAA-like protein n=1 Tax=Bremerella volcania TaxID=2527984 RepID=A0A518C5R7_9BACT|nr:STAS/SEC14 domain-containing protein [Bremerella volcania]QDU74552.1 hypothetical protein Pan97_15610 [Bremerella volcania]